MATVDNNDVTAKHRHNGNSREEFALELPTSDSSKNLLRSQYPHSLLITTNSDDESKNDYQPGGMFMALNNNII